MQLKIISSFLILLSLVFLVPSVVFAATSDGSVDSKVEINDSIENGPTLANGYWFGRSVENVGDLDGNGVNDLAVGAILDPAGGTKRGAVHIIFLNSDGTLTKQSVEIDDSTANGPTLSDNDRFGYAIANIGDLDGNGVNDLVVGAAHDDTASDGNDGALGVNSNIGAVHIIFLNSDGTLTKQSVEINDSTANGPVLGLVHYFGRSVENVGDLDGNGVNDLAVGAIDGNGAVHIIFLNSDGTLTKQSVEINGSTENGPTLANGDQFGFSVANIGDLDGNEVNDLAVGAIYDDGTSTDRGAVHIIFLNSDGTLTKQSVEINDSTANGPTDEEDSDFFGTAVEKIGDLDGNGVNDLAVGAFDDNGEGTDRGAVHIIFLNSDGTLTKQSVEINDSTANGPTLSDTDKFGTSVADIGDLDGNGVNDLAVGAYLDNGVGSNRGVLHIIFMHKTTTPIEEEEVKKSSDCYDCEAPKLTKVEVHVSSSPFDYVWNFDQKSPYPMFGDDITPIIADPGDEVEIILELTDNRTLKRVYDSGTYTNFLTKPNDMNTFYANNFDEYGKVSTTYYEWHQTGEDLVYDYESTVQWSPAEILIEESAEFVEGGQAPNLDGLVETFTISFKIKFLQPMQTSDVWVQATDRSGNFFKVALPLTLKISGNEPLLFESKVNQKVLSFFDESVLLELTSDWNGTSQDVSELATILGISDEQLPPWVANLAVWVSEDRITLADMIVSIEHLINN